MTQQTFSFAAEKPLPLPERKGFTLPTKHDAAQLAAARITLSDPAKYGRLCVRIARLTIQRLERENHL